LMQLGVPTSRNLGTFPSFEKRQWLASDRIPRCDCASIVVENSCEIVGFDCLWASTAVNRSFVPGGCSGFAPKRGPAFLPCAWPKRRFSPGSSSSGLHGSGQRDSRKGGDTRASR